MQYRVWYKTDKKMYYGQKFILSPDGQLYYWYWGSVSGLVEDKSIIMPCTGFKDSNNKLVYRHDFVTLHRDAEIYEVDIDNKTGQWIFKNAFASELFDQRLINEVVGNSFEDKDITKKVYGLEY